MNSYLITIDPKKSIANTVNIYRKKYSKYTTYKIPPHITIYPPFYLKNVTEKEILELLKNSFAKKDSCTLNFNSINYFEEDNNVAFFAPNQNSLKPLKNIFSKTINVLAGKTQDVYDNYKLSAKDFIPHMTIAEQIPDTEFKKTKEELDKIGEELIFDCNSVSLYKQEESLLEWKKVDEVSFSL